MKTSLSIALLVLLVSACGDDTGTGGEASTATSASPSSTGATGSPSATGSTATVTSATSVTATGQASSSATGAGAEPDPDLDGPYTFDDVSGTFAVAATGNSVAMKAFYPTAGPSAGPYPIVLVGHGFQIATSQYESYAKRLASFGYVAVLPAFEAGFLAANNVENARDLLGGIDWAAGEATLAPIADTQVVGTTGHSLGGKVALLAATFEPRVKASITLDPVDGAMNCSPTDCPDVSSLLPLGIPTGFVGETLDATGSFMACAPAADNYETFYANASAPALAVTVLGAGHMSFLDDAAQCAVCGFCKMPTLAAPTVGALSRAFVTAFFERHLRGDARYDAYLTGAIAQARYVDTALVTIASK